MRHNPRTRSQSVAAQRTRLRVVVNCAARKRIEPPDQLQMRSVEWRGPMATARLWTTRLEQLEAPTTLARDLYAGDHWNIAISLESLAVSVGVDLDLWIVSAGYGLIRQFDLIKPYAAAFSQGQVDSVAHKLRGSERRKALREWWKEMGRWAGVGSTVRSLEGLAQQEPKVPMLVALSAPYLDAVMEDLTRARQGFDNPSSLLVVSAGTKSADTLAENVLPANGSLQRAVGGPLHSLNARIARWIVGDSRSHGFKRDLIVEQLRQLATRAGIAPKEIGNRMSDSDVKAFVREHLNKDVPSSRSALLRDLRGRGNSCEQARFSRLFSLVLGARD